jgi:hypothetical protein
VCFLHRADVPALAAAVLAPSLRAQPLHFHALTNFNVMSDAYDRLDSEGLN